MIPQNEEILKQAFVIAKKVKAKAIFIHIDPLENLKFTGKIPKNIKIFLIGKRKSAENLPEGENSLALCSKALLSIPKINMTRIGIIKVAITLALSADHISRGDKAVFVVGSQEIGTLDHIQIIDTQQESEIVTGKSIVGLSENVRPEVFQAVLSLSIELANKGREGKPIGTIFVVGDHEKVMQLSKQMIINPFKGYDEEERNILAPSLKETIREFSAMDGAFVISDSGIVLTAGRYLGATSESATLTQGLGSRHIAAAGITALTKAIAFVISESSGDVRIFKNGKSIMEIEKAPTRK